MFFLMKISSDSRMWTGWNSHWCSLFKRYDRPTTWLTRYACLFSQDYAKKSSNVIRQTSTDTMTHEPKTFEMIHRAVARRIMENLLSPLKSRFTCPHSRMPVLGKNDRCLGFFTVFLYCIQICNILCTRIRACTNFSSDRWFLASYFFSPLRLCHQLAKSLGIENRRCHLSFFYSMDNSVL